MNYRKLGTTPLTVSALGYGCMRLPRIPGEDAIDVPEAVRLIRRGIDNGITYVDTAYGYHRGESERVVGKALKDGYREKVTLVTKLPVWLVKEYDDMEKLLDEQLAKLEVDHLDVYLAHALDKEGFIRVRDLGLFRFMDEMVKKGKIRYPGFSFHDDADAFRYILDSYDWKVCQIQMNFLDEFNQATLKGAEYAASKGIGVIVMEPLRGGSLAGRLPATVKALYEASDRPELSAAAHCFRWLIDKPCFSVILSGMSAQDQLDENLAIFSENDVGCMNDSDRQLMKRVYDDYTGRIRVGCTGCEYCQPCPQGIKIPDIFRMVDELSMFDRMEDLPKRYERFEVKADACVACYACVSACPQNFKTPIPEMLRAIHAEAQG